MTLSYDMYPAKNNSPITVLTADLNSSDSVMTVENAGVLPDAPNLAVIGGAENAEIVLYTAKNGNNITIRRGLNNTIAGVWTTGTPVARNFTAYDHDTFIANIRDLENRKQDTLTFDTTPTADSTNPVTSGGIKTAIDTKQDTLTFDSAPTASSTNPVESGGVKTALDAKQDTLTFDSTPTADSTNPVTSGGVKTALDTLDDAKVSKSGDTMTGSLRFNNANLFFQKNSVTCGQIYPSNGNAIVLRNFSEGSSKSEYFYTPTPDKNLQNDKSYYFLTTKNVVTVAQGGTGGTDSGWKSLTNSTAFSGTIYYRKIGAFCELRSDSLTLAAELTTTSGVILGNLPSGYRPATYNVHFPASSTFSSGLVNVTTSGNIGFYKERSLSTWDTSRSFYLNQFFLCA